MHVNRGRAHYLDVAGLFHEPAGILCCSVAFRELDSEELESPFEIGLQKVLFGRLQRARAGQEERAWEEVAAEIKEKRQNESYCQTEQIIRHGLFSSAEALSCIQDIQ